MDDYYDLIELPSGAHIPVPIAKKLVGEEAVRKIPVSHKVRNELFFECPICGERGFYSGLCPDCWLDAEHDDELEEFANKWYYMRMSDYPLKEKAFVNMVKKRRFRKLRYIKAEE